MAKAKEQKATKELPPWHDAKEQALEPGDKVLLPGTVKGRASGNRIEVALQVGGAAFEAAVALVGGKQCLRAASKAEAKEAVADFSEAADEELARTEIGQEVLALRQECDSAIKGNQATTAKLTEATGKLEEATATIAALTEERNRFEALAKAGGVPKK